MQISTSVGVVHVIGTEVFSAVPTYISQSTKPENYVRLSRTYTAARRMLS
jgi:hypothetical protein